MPSKIIKIQRKLADRLGLNRGRKVLYHLGRSNFGDDINEWFFSELTGERCIYGGAGRDHILGIGSIANKANENSLVCGSGFLVAPSSDFSVAKPRQIVSVRGELSAKIFGVSPEFMGDPVVFLDSMYACPKSKKYKLGIVPHVSNYKEVRAMVSREVGSQLLPSVDVINPGNDFRQVVQEMNQCERIASQSLHGLICADSYGIPSVWIEPSANMWGGEFKFIDYFSAILGQKVKVKCDDWVALARIESYSVGEFKYSKGHYMGFLKDALLTRPK